MKKIYLSLIVLLFMFRGFSQPPTTPEVFVKINSGNPAFPFPQFLAYESVNHSLGNLATNNAPGVTHAEMEQTIRDAWQIMANRFKYSGESYGGVRYIRSNIGCPYDCTEGEGYAMLAAAEMGDKTTFDGIWFRTHDLRMIKQPRYRDCVVPDPGYLYGEFSLKDNTDSAADGDFDVALALQIAWKQWGDDSGYTDACGNPIRYRDEALKVIRGLVERTDRGLGDCRRVSGDIGFDGYIKGGNTGNELTNWATGSLPECPEFAGPTEVHIDYAAPSYFHAFADFLRENGDARDQGWNINQFGRAEASSDWLMGKMLDNPSTLPLAGWVGLDNANNPTYRNFLDGEDFRNPWRTVLNYVWHGDPMTKWNPASHQVEAGGNSYEQNIGKRLAKFLANPGDAPWANDCSAVGGGPALTYNGPSQIKNYYNPITGKEQIPFPLNWLVGTGTPSAVAAQDYDLMGKLYRQCAIEWDITTAGDGYLTSIPGYFHGFFRLLGMLTVSGNHHSPAETEVEANVKVYHNVDKTFAFTDDEIEYTISYRNYASVAANGVQITTEIPAEFSFVSATDGGTNSENKVTWTIGNVPGFKSSTGVTPTTGEVKLVLKVNKGVSGRICNSFEITTTNGKGWISNEFPNEETAVMQRNCVDIVEKALEITKTVNHEEVNPGDEVMYTVDFENASSGGFLNGGRQDVNIAYAHGGHATESSEKLVKIRLYHGAAEPYIDYGNYRISLFLNDNAATCVSGEPGCTGLGWVLDNQIYEGGDASKVSITSEPIVPGSDTNGAWNQRVIVRFSEQLATITPHVSRYFGIEGGRVHLGGAEPLRAVWQMHTDRWSSVTWNDDWSWNPAVSDASDGLFFPVTNNWTDPNNPDLPVTVYHNEACEKPTTTIDNILVEEWDGFTWRRIYGNSPAPGRETENVIVKDVLPVGFTFVSFVDDIGTNLGDSITILGETASYDKATRTITWTKPKLQVKEKGSFKYTAIANFSSGSCQRADELQINTASIEAENESPVIANAEVTITCTPVILPPPPSSMTKTVMPEIAVVDDEVTYTLEYENTDGSPFEADFSRPWTAQVGALMTVSPTGVSTIPNNLGVSTHNFSYGTNGTLEATVNFASDQAFGFALRHSGSGGINGGLYIVFKPNFGSGNGTVTVYDGVTAIGNTSVPIAGNPTDIKLVLAEDQLQLWVGNISSPTPNWVATGLPVRNGYTGLINGFPNGNDTSGRHELIHFKSNMDAAFNLQVTDPVPAEMEFVSAADGGVLNANIVTYPELAGPVLAGTKLSYTWRAKVKSCPVATSKIINEAYTNGLGLPLNFIRAQAIVDCSGIDLCSSVVVPMPTPNIPEFCVGDMANDIDTYITATETLVWYIDAVSTSSIAKPIIDTSVKSTVTYYVSQKTADDCESDRMMLEVIVNEAAASQSNKKTIKSGDTVDYDIVADFGLEAGNIQWITTTNLEIEGESSVVATADTITDVLINTTNVSQEITYSITSIPVLGCAPQPSKLVVTVLPPTINLTAIINEASAEEGNDLVFPVELTELALTDIEITFSIGNISTTEADYIAGILSIIIPAGEDKGELRISTVDDTEIEKTEELEVTIVNVNGIPTIFPSNAIGEITDNDESFVCAIDTTPVPNVPEFCVGDPVADINTYVIATETLVWYADILSTSPIEKPIINTSVKLTTTYYVSQKTVDDCESERVAITVVVNERGASQSDKKTIKSGDAVEYDIVTEFGLEIGNVNWIATTSLEVGGESVLLNTSNIITDVLVNTTGVSQEVIYIIESSPTTGCAPKFSELIVTVLPPTISLTAIIDGVSVEEGNDLVFPVTLTEKVTTDTEIVFSISDVSTTVADYTVGLLSITILAGEDTGALVIKTIDDIEVELTEELEVSVLTINGNPVPIETNAIGEITDNDTARCGILPMPNVSEASFCLNEIPDAIGNYVVATETLVWYETATSTAPISLPIIDTSTASERVYFVSQKASDICESTRAELMVKVSTRIEGKSDAITIESGESVNYDIVSLLGLSPGNITWSATPTNFVLGVSQTVNSDDFINDVLENTTTDAQVLIYTIKESSISGCNREDSQLMVTINPKDDIIFPLFFTPNNDFANDFWQVSSNNGVAISGVQIYDRYGKLLAVLNPLSTGWNGEFNGVQLPADDYWCVVLLEDGSQKRGHFSLVR